MINRKWLGALVGVAVLATACGSSGGSKGGGAYGSSTTKPSKSASSSTEPAPAGQTTLQLVDTALGKVVANSDGMVLYLYVPDGTSPTSKVSAALLVAWPPLKATETVTLGAGLTKKAATPSQSNGEKWVSYNDHLLYTFSGDAAPGDVNGNALASVWYAVTAAGEPVQS